MAYEIVGSPTQTVPKSLRPRREQKPCEAPTPALRSSIQEPNQAPRPPPALRPDSPSSVGPPPQADDPWQRHCPGLPPPPTAPTYKSRCRQSATSTEQTQHPAEDSSLRPTAPKQSRSLRRRIQAAPSLSAR